MTLLEALFATVILAVAAVACLEGTRGAAELQVRAAAVNSALSRAEAALEQPFEQSPETSGEPEASRYRARYPAIPDGAVEKVSVEVRDPQGRTIRLTRLVDSRATPDGAHRASMTAPPAPRADR